MFSLVLCSDTNSWDLPAILIMYVKTSVSGDKASGGPGVRVLKWHRIKKKPGGKECSWNRVDFLPYVLFLPWYKVLLFRTYGYQQGGWGEGMVRVAGMDMYTLLYLKQITNKYVLSSTGNSAQCYVAAWTGRESGEEWIQVYVWLNPFAVYLKLLQHCSLVIPQYKIKSF